MTESDIRSALRRKLLQYYRLRPDTLVIDELGLAHARRRVDIAVINGYIHGYEIKSGQDDLGRLGGQMEVYRQTLQKLTIVTASRHRPRLWYEVPDWCGVIEAEQGPRRGVKLQVVRSAKLNPEVDSVMLAHLLWRPEVIELLARIGYASKDLRCPRKRLYEMLCESLSSRQISEEIHGFMARRQAWRVHLTHT